MIEDKNVNLNNKDVKSLLLKMNLELQRCINEEKFVAVHLRTKKIEIRFCISPDEADFSVNGIYVVQDMLQININHVIKSIEQLEDKSFKIIMDDVEIYTDFVDSYF